MFKINAKNLSRIEQNVVDKNNWAFERSLEIESKEHKEKDGFLSHLSNCVVSIKPVRSEEPVYLYGSKQKVLTFNKVTISEALVNKENKSDIKKGDTIIEFFVTDETLSLAMIDQGGEVQPVTFSQLQNEKLDLRYIEPPINSVELEEENLEKGSKKQSQFIKDALEGLISELAKNKPSKKNVNQLMIQLKSAIYNIRANAEYGVQTLAENLNRDINSVNFELQTTIDHLLHYSDSSNVNLLEDLSDEYQEQSYLKWIMTGFNYLEKETFYNVLKRINKENPSSKLSDAINSYEESKKTKSRPNGDITDGAISFSSVMGRTQLAHDNNEQDKVIEMRLNKSYISTDYKIRYNIGREILRIAFSPNDLLMLLRSREDSFILGTMVRFGGKGVPIVKLQEYVTETIALDENMKGLNKELISMQVALEDLMNAPMKKAEKTKALAIIKEIEEELIKTSARIISKATESQQNVKHVFEERLKAKITTSLKGLPEHYTKDIMKLLT